MIFKINKRKQKGYKNCCFLCNEMVKINADFHMIYILDILYDIF